MTELDRRTLVRGLGVLTVSGALAGCTGGGGDGGDSPDEGGSDGSDGTDSTTNDGESTTGGGGDGDNGGGGVPAEVSDYLSGASNFDGSVADMTGEDSVTVTVGASGNGGNFAFGPAAVRVDAGTTVVWEWNGKGGSHNVVAESGDFESELTGESGHTFEQTFDAAGTVTYNCAPHKSLGMKGAVVVE